MRTESPHLSPGSREQAQFVFVGAALVRAEHPTSLRSAEMLALFAKVGIQHIKSLDPGQKHAGMTIEIMPG